MRVAAESAAGRVEIRCSLIGGVLWSWWWWETSWERTSSELGQLPPRRTWRAVARSLESSEGKCGTLCVWVSECVGDDLLA